MWLIFSILTVVLWGTSDVVFKKCSSDTKESVLKLLSCNGIVLGICSIIYMCVQTLLFGYIFDPIVLLKYLPVALIYITSMMFYYKAMPLIKISLASPIANSSCVMTSLLCFFILKQKVSPLQIFAIILIVIAIVLISIDKSEVDKVEEKEVKSKRKLYILGILFALCYFALDGLGSFCDDAILYDLEETDVLVSYGFIYMLCGFAAYIALLQRRKKNKDGIRQIVDIDKRVFLGSLVETAGQFTYIYAFASGDAVIASPFIASFSMVSIILSRIFLKEKLKLKQYVIILCMLAGMAILAIE